VDSGDLLVQNVSDYKAVFETANGKRVLWDLMKASGYTQTNFDENPYKSAHNEGARSMVVRIINLLEMDTGKIKAMIGENRKKESNYEFNGGYEFGSGDN